MTDPIVVTSECSPNIALIKYWGKSNEELILPLNGSISITLDKSVLRTKTTVVLEKNTDQSLKSTIKICLNNELQEVDETNPKSNGKQVINVKRFISVLNMVRNSCLISDPYSYNISISSNNNFPTACGLASSASGFACLALCLANAFQYKGDISELARLGSGSACRSCFGGFVKWTAHEESNKSVASVLFDHNHWPEMNILALILEDERKIVSSTDGMRDTTKTSQLLKHRVDLVERERLTQMETAIRDKDFNSFAELVMKDSNNFHAICMDTYPPLFYLNDKSKLIIRLVTEFNKLDGDNNLKAAYSFDAGPNSFIFILDKYVLDFVYLLKNINFEKSENVDKNFILSVTDDFLRLEEKISDARKAQLDDFIALFNNRFCNEKRFIKYLIHSKVGNDPLVSVNDWSVSLLKNNCKPVDK